MMTTTEWFDDADEEDRLTYCAEVTDAWRRTRRALASAACDYDDKFVTVRGLGDFVAIERAKCASEEISFCGPIREG